MKKVFLLSTVLMVIAGCGASEKQRALLQEKEQKLKILEEEQELLVEKLKKQRQAIRELAQEYGSKNLDKKQEIKLERIGMLLSELTKCEALALKTEAQINILRKTIEDQNTDEQKLSKAELKLANAEIELELNNIQTDMALTKEACEKISLQIKELESD